MSDVQTLLLTAVLDSITLISFQLTFMYWQVYSRDPACWDANSTSNCLWNLPKEQHHLFLGVEACAWGEATDNFNIDRESSSSAAGIIATLIVVA